MKEKIIFVDGIRCFYLEAGKGQPAIFLHGWGGSSKSLIKPIENLSRQFLIFSPDLPGFGKTSPPQVPWKVANFSHFIIKFANTLKIKNFFLIGHSFGGRIAIKIAANQPEKIKKLVLCNASGIEPKNLIKKYTFIAIAKFGKILFLIWPLCLFKNFARKFLYKLAREQDYFLTKGTMHQTFKRIITEDLSKDLEKITVPTLILWGEKDKQTPPPFGKTMHQLIKNSQFIVIPKATHGLPFLKPKTFARRISVFFKKDSS